MSRPVLVCFGANLGENLNNIEKFVHQTFEYLLTNYYGVEYYEHMNSYSYVCTTETGGMTDGQDRYYSP